MVIGTGLGWGNAPTVALAVAALPINRSLIRRGRGHAVVHAHLGHH
jgi:hypothetical protein